MDGPVSASLHIVPPVREVNFSTWAPIHSVCLLYLYSQSTKPLYDISAPAPTGSTNSFRLWILCPRQRRLIQCVDFFEIGKVMNLDIGITYWSQTYPYDNLLPDDQALLEEDFKNLREFLATDREYYSPLQRGDYLHWHILIVILLPLIMPSVTHRHSHAPH